MISRFSIRSLLITTVGVSICMAVPKAYSPSSIYLIYVAMFAAAASSLGFDFEPNRKGIINGCSWGVLIGSVLAHAVVVGVLDVV